MKLGWARLVSNIVTPTGGVGWAAALAGRSLRERGGCVITGGTCETTSVLYAAALENKVIKRKKRNCDLLPAFD